MSWISGEFVINDMSQRSMEEAKKNNFFYCTSQCRS